MKRVIGNYEVIIDDDPLYSRNSTDNHRSYIHEYCRDEKYQHFSAHGIEITQNGESLSSAILLGVGGATGINENSLAFDGVNLYVTAGDALYSLSIPDLDMKWCVQVDIATCFGVFWLQSRGCLLTWGEIEIGCYSITGNKLWGSSGPEIFTEGIEFQDSIVKVTDFNGDIHEINLNNGEISIANT